MRTLSKKEVLLAFGFGVMLITTTSKVSAQVYDSIGHWDYTSQAVTFVIQNTDTGGYTFGSEDFVKDTLPHEWSTSNPTEALLTGALLIRSGVWYYYNHPESSDPSITNESGKMFNFRDSNYLGWDFDSQYQSENAPTNSAVNGTYGRVVYQNGSAIYTPFNDCVQLETDTLATQGYTHTTIITSSSIGIYSQQSKYGCNSQYEPYLPNLAFATAYN